MAKLRMGGQEYPLVMTVGVIGDMERSGIPMQDIPKFFSPAEHPMEEALYNGVKFLHGLIEAGQVAASLREGKEMEPIPMRETLQRLLTPGQVWGLCDAAILDSLKRTVEAAPEKNEAQ